MLPLTVIAALVGAALALRFNVLALVPTTLFVLVIVALGLVERGDPAQWIGATMFATAACVQLGYFGACLLQIVLAGKVGRRKLKSRDRQAHP